MDFDEEIFYPDDGFSEFPSGGGTGDGNSGYVLTNDIGDGSGVYDGRLAGCGWGEEVYETFDKSGYGRGSGDGSGEEYAEDPYSFGDE